jgi:hypothetical protein
VADEDHAAEVARLRAEWADALERSAALATELKGLSEWVGPIREAFGNPYFYSGVSHARPENAEHSAAKYTGQASHEVVGGVLLPLLRRLDDLRREMTAIRERLSALGNPV